MVSYKVKSALVAALLFYVISSPFTYKMVDKLVGKVVELVIPSMAFWFKVAESGCPTNYGLFVHSVVFGLVTYYVCL